jgi:hypothetical protein
MRIWRPSRHALLLGLIVGVVFGFVNLLFTWLYPLADDTPGALLGFYGPMFFVWTLVSFRAARRTGRLLSGLTTGLTVAFATFWAYDLLILVRVNVFLDELTGRADWQNLMTRFRDSESDSLRLFVNLDYFTGAPLKLAVSCAIGAAMGTLGGLLGQLTYKRTAWIGTPSTPEMKIWMHRTLLVCAIGAGFWSAITGGQTAVPVALPGELRARVQDERFQIVSSIRGLPLGVRTGLQTLLGSPTLDIAEPGAEFQAGDAIVNAGLPSRRLAVAGCSYVRCLVYYERGGTARTWRVALFHWTPDETRFEWGGTAPGGLATIDDVRSAVLSGAIKDPAGLW